MDSMAALFEAVGLTPSATSPSAAANDAAGEPSPAAPLPNPASSRLSFALPVAETPEPATTLAARGETMPTVNMTTISMSPAAHSAEVRAALDMAAVTAKLHAKIQDLENDKVVAAIISERDKVFFENLQLRRDMEHLHAVHEQRTRYEREATLLQSRLAATPAVPSTPDEPAVDGPATVAPATTKLIISQLALNNPPATIAANALADEADVERIANVVSRLMQGLHIVPGGPELRVAVSMIFQLPHLSDLVNAKGVVYQNTVAILEACAHHGGGADRDDATSTTGSDAPDAGLIEHHEDIFGYDAASRATYQRLVRYLSGGDGGMPHLGMKNWGPMSLHLHGYLIALLGDGPNHKLALRQPSFLEVVQHLLLRAKHSVETRLQRDFGIVCNPVAYTNKAGTFEGVRPTNLLLALADDIDTRMRAMEALQSNPLAFIITMAAKSLPLGEPGSEVRSMLATVNRKLHVAAARKPTLPKIFAIIDKTII